MSKLVGELSKLSQLSVKFESDIVIKILTVYFNDKRLNFVNGIPI